MAFVPKDDQISEYEESLDDVLRNLGLKGQEVERMKEKEKEMAEEIKMLRNNKLGDQQLLQDNTDQKRAYILLEQKHEDLSKKYETQEKQLSSATQQIESMEQNQTNLGK